MEAVDKLESLFKTRGYLSPKSIDPITLKMVVSDDVVEKNCPTGSDIDRICIEIVFDTFVSVVAIDEK